MKVCIRPGLGRTGWRWRWLWPALFFSGGESLVSGLVSGLRCYCSQLAALFLSSFILLCFILLLFSSFILLFLLFFCCFLYATQKKPKSFIQNSVSGHFFHKFVDLCSKLLAISRLFGFSINSHLPVAGVTRQTYCCCCYGHMQICIFTIEKSLLVAVQQQQ